MRWTIIRKLTVTAMALSLFSCDGNYSVDSGANSNGSNTNTNSTAPNSSDAGVFCGTSEFCVNVVPPANTTMVLHKDGNFNQPCDVSPGTDTACILEANELDLYAQGMLLNYNVPAGMCSYMNMQPYFYYAYQPAIGPTAVTLSVNAATGAITETAEAPGIPAANTPTTHKATVRTPYTLTPTCSADYTSVGGPNCCSGSYQLTIVTGATATTTTQKWGGNPNNCLAGPALDTQTLETGQPGSESLGYPKSTLYTLDGVSLNKKYQVKSPLSKNLFSNAFIANYWASGATGDYPLTNDGIGLGSPNAMQGPNVPAGEFLPGCIAGGFCTGNPWYEFDCLDPAQDVVARIRVLVRSWTSATNFSTFVTNQTNLPANGTFNLFGPEPTPFGDQPIEDYQTWVTPFSSVLGAGVTGTVAAPCYNSGLPNQDCGFGSMYPEGAN